MDDLLEQPTRRRIYEVVGTNPGSSARDIQRLAGLAWGETAYHLDQLTRGGAVRRERGGRRDFYFQLAIDWEDRQLLRSLRSSAQRRILLTLVTRPNLGVAELCEETGLSASTTSFHLRELLAIHAVEIARHGNLRRFRTLKPERLTQLFEAYRESFQDRLVDRFVETWSSLLR
ncbi:MAG: helix-turn-helix domain-containing protein [Thermoplasmata archaeon]|nr:helix-turn-helix domain-containing protein [Thermoplasmata archaeon]